MAFKTRADVIQGHDGGYIVSMPDHRGREQFVGKDDFWTRVYQAAMPWKTKAEAQAKANDLNDPR